MVVVDRLVDVGERLRLDALAGVDDEDRPVPQGEPGELAARGPQIMLGYWNRPDETEATLRGGWLHTGDIAVMDPDGYFQIVDRKKDMINVSGFNVYPNEVEDCIARIDAVQEVGVIGVADEKTGEAVCAFVVCVLTDAACEACCATWGCAQGSWARADT